MKSFWELIIYKMVKKWLNVSLSTKPINILPIWKIIHNLEIIFYGEYLEIVKLKLIEFMCYIKNHCIGGFL